MGAPAPGTVVEGYVFRGGNHRDKASWEKLAPAPSGYRYREGASELEPIPGGPGDMAGAETRGRVKLGLPASVEAQKRMNELQRRWNPETKTQERLNPYREELLPSVMAGIGWDNGERMTASQNYQDYDQANKTFESSLLPIFSGSAVVQSEASRFIRANLPTYGDTPETLVKKERNRSMILNAAARMGGYPIPFPDVPTWGITPGREQQGQQQSPNVIDFNDLPDN